MSGFSDGFTVRQKLTPEGGHVVALRYLYSDAYVDILSHHWHFQRTAHGAAGTFETVGMEETFFLISAFMRSELHGAYGGAEFTSGCAFLADKNAAVAGRQIAAARCDPRRERTHRAEGAPGAWRIYE